MKPSKELTKKAGLAKKDQINQAVAWAELFMSIPITLSGFTTIDEAQYDSKGHMIMDMDEFAAFEKGIVFNLHLGISNEEGNFITCSVDFFKKNEAKIDEDVFQGEMPEFLLGNPIFGFSGTWEEVTYKIIELNDIVNSQIPVVPENLKK